MQPAASDPDSALSYERHLFDDAAASVLDDENMQYCGLRSPQRDGDAALEELNKLPSDDPLTAQQQEQQQRQQQQQELLDLFQHWLQQQQEQQQAEPSHAAAVSVACELDAAAPHITADDGFAKQQQHLQLQQQAEPKPTSVAPAAPAALMPDVAALRAEAHEKDKAAKALRAAYEGKSIAATAAVAAVDAGKLAKAEAKVLADEACSALAAVKAAEAVAAEAFAAAVAAADPEYGCSHVRWEDINRPDNNANSVGKNGTKARVELVRRLPVLVPGAGVIFDTINARNNPSTGKPYSKTGARWPMEFHVEFLQSVLGREGQPGSAPWPKANELKPLTLLLYMARLLRWVLGKDNITAADANRCFADGRTYPKGADKTVWRVNRGAAAALGLPVISKLPLQPVLPEEQQEVKRQAQQQQQQQQAAGGRQAGAAALLQQLQIGAGQAQQPKRVRRASQQASAANSSKASDGTGYRPPADLTRTVATTLQVNVQRAYSLRTERAPKRSYSRMAAGE